MTRPQATFIGFGAVLLWSLLAALTVEADPVPPFQLVAMTFAVASLSALVWLAADGKLYQLARVPLRVTLFGTLGLFGYHALYFAALRLAPAAEASLINYLWPLFIVLFSGLLPGEVLRPGHVVGAVVAFLGAALVVAAGITGVSAGALPGYGLAFAAALTWGSYSVLSRRLASVPSAAVALYLIGATLLSALCHVLFEQTQMPAHPGGWLAIIGLGLGPVGLAFFLWDIGMKRGDIQLLGTASYAAPILSTGLLLVFGYSEPRRDIVVAAGLITLGALIAARSSRAARRL